MEEGVEELCDWPCLDGCHHVRDVSLLDGCRAARVLGECMELEWSLSAAILEDSLEAELVAALSALLIGLQLVVTGVKVDLDCL